MEAHGGRLELAARPKGTCFGVYLPVEAEATRPRPAGPATRWFTKNGGGRMTSVTEGSRKTRALVVEDDPNIVDLIRSNLAVRGFDTVVSRGRHAGAAAAGDRGTRTSCCST